MRSIGEWVLIAWQYSEVGLIKYTSCKLCIILCSNQLSQTSKYLISSGNKLEQLEVGGPKNVDHNK